MKKKTPFPTVDWDKVFKKLTYSALAWIIKKKVNRNDPMIKGVGPADLAQRALCAVVEKYSELAREGSEDELVRLAYTMMWHDFLDLVDSSDYKTRENLEDLAGTGKEPIHEAQQEKEEEDRSAVKRYYAIADGDPKLVEYIDAILTFPEYRREDVAELLGVTVQEITNRQRRLRYKCLAREK